MQPPLETTRGPPRSGTHIATDKNQNLNRRKGTFSIPDDFYLGNFGTDLPVGSAERSRYRCEVSESKKKEPRPNRYCRQGKNDCNKETNAVILKSHKLKLKRLNKF